MQWWGSIEHHRVVVIPTKVEPRRRRKCHCGCGKRETHTAVANGVAMSSGCEMSMWRWAQQMNRRYRGVK